MHSIHVTKQKRACLIDLRLVELFYGEALMNSANESQIVINAPN